MHSMKLGSGLNLISIKINNMLIVRRRNNNNFSSDGSGIIVLTRVMMIWFGWNLGWNWLETNREGTILDRTRNHNFGKIKKQWMVGLVISIFVQSWIDLEGTAGNLWRNFRATRGATSIYNVYRGTFHRK